MEAMGFLIAAGVAFQIWVWTIIFKET